MKQVPEIHSTHHTLAERSPFFEVRSELVRKIGPEHFAHTKAVLQGVDWKRSASHFLGCTDELLHRAVTDVVLQMLKIRGVKVDGAPSAQPVSAALSRPTLDEFIDARGLHEFPEDECLIAYEEAYGSTDSRHIKASQLDCWSWEYLKESKDPGHDNLEVWFRKRESKSMRLIGAHTVGDASSLVSSREGFDALEFMLGRADAISAAYKSKLLTYGASERWVVSKKISGCHLAMKWVGRNGISKNTRALCKQACVKWLFWSSEKVGDVLSPTQHECLEFVEWMTKTNAASDKPWKAASSATTEVIGNVLSGFYQWLKDSGHVDDNPWKGCMHFIRAKKHQQSQPSLTPAASLDYGNEVAIRSQVILTLMQETGLKLKSLTALESQAWHSHGPNGSSLIFKGVPYSLSNAATTLMRRYMHMRWESALPCSTAPLFSRIGDRMAKARYESLREPIMKLCKLTTS